MASRQERTPKRHKLPVDPDENENRIPGYLRGTTAQKQRATPPKKNDGPRPPRGILQSNGASLSTANHGAVANSPKREHPTGVTSRTGEDAKARSTRTLPANFKNAKGSRSSYPPSYFRPSVAAAFGDKHSGTLKPGRRPSSPRRRAAACFEQGSSKEEGQTESKTKSRESLPKCRCFPDFLSP